MTICGQSREISVGILSVVVFQFDFAPRLRRQAGGNF
jgi:hypothetical protein